MTQQELRDFRLLVKRVDLLYLNGTGGVSGSGFSGYSGRSGYSGYSGANGASGISGYSGYSGSGISGYSGTNGSNGASGTSGYSGYSGASAGATFPLEVTPPSAVSNSFFIINKFGGADFFHFTMDEATGIMAIVSDGGNPGTYLDFNDSSFEVNVRAKLFSRFNSTFVAYASGETPIYVLGRTGQSVPLINVKDDTDTTVAGVNKNYGLFGKSLVMPWRVLSGDDTMTLSDFTVRFTTAATFTMLPLASVEDGTIIVIVNDSAGTINVDGDGSETIDGNPTLAVLTTTRKMLQKQNTGWRSIS